MKTLRFKGLLQNNGWLSPAYVSIDDNGIIQKISDHATQDNNVELIEGLALPGFQNAHSHAFQYAMVGLAEDHEPTAGLNDNFWSWREKMYQIALSINPDQLEAIAARLYAEMVRHGYTHVAEFHYLHLDPKGKPYSNKAELAEKLISAANSAGINITMVPIFYQKGGFGKDAGEEQKRFICKNRSAYFDLWQITKAICDQHDHASIAMGIHSLRAVESQEIIATLNDVPSHIPIHMHVSEQLLEVEESQKYLGQRPVEWLSSEIGLNENFHLVHATHLNVSEIINIADSGANVVLCPSTEGNLGDGLFPYKKFQESNGRWSIGTDSHIGLNPMEELRWLDYGQRTDTHNRNTFHSSSQKCTGGSVAIDQSFCNGRMAMGFKEKAFFRIGGPLNSLVVDAGNPLIQTTDLNHLASTIVYSSDATFNLGTMINGKWMVKNNVHRELENINRQFMLAMKDLDLR